MGDNSSYDNYYHSVKNDMQCRCDTQKMYGQYELIGDPYSVTNNQGKVYLDNGPIFYNLVKPNVLLKKGFLGSQVPYTKDSFNGVF